ncbi:HRDC domain-containing protein [Microcella daejeonensis]|uniref:HRDC domain-containing protein n=1 Tax=Microcella daejeonensis TaxID=2994971 RepID=UPI00226D4DED|nr:HRDC domain-containing protein [Microcella daejeonensis]WAB85321.1 HRDC domain-containing protein [Microcella daejeonensis]
MAVPASPPFVIETREDYLDAVAALRAGHGPVAVDAERASGFRYSQRAYLIQVFRRGSGTFMFDPPAVGDFSELQEAIGGEEWVLHAASQDLPCLRELDLEPRSLFDTELGARLAGLPRVGLGAVVEETLGLHLAKEHSAADWSTRPLPASWLTYAALDVELLVDVRDAIAARLKGDGKAELAAEEFAAVLSRSAPEPKAEPWRRLSGLHTVRGQRALAVARELWLARDAYAREIDSAPGRLLPDASIIVAARSAATSKRELAALQGFHGRASRSQLDRWWAAIETGRTTADLPVLRSGEETIPPPRSWADRNPEADRRLKIAKPAVAAVGEARTIPLENLLTPDHLRRLAWNPPAEIDADSIAAALAELGARAWQIDATAQVIARAFVDAAQGSDEAAETPS